ncbi:MAG: lipopolysaccharide biosynthesis protein [Bacteroidota bacterium]
MDIYSELKGTAKLTVVYALGTMAPKLAGLILVPLYTKHLPVSEYGILGLLDLTLHVTIFLVGLELATALIRWYSIAESEEEKKKTMFTTTVATVGFGAICFLVIVATSDLLTQILFGVDSSNQPGQRFGYYIQLVVLIAIFDRLLIIPLSLLRIQERALRYSTISFLRFTFLVILNLVFVGFYHLGIEGVLLGILLSTALSFGLTLPYLLKNIQFGFLRDQLNEMLRYGLPVMGASLAMIILNLSDRYLLKLLSTLDSVGLYTLGYQIAGLINLLFVSSFALGFYPAIFKVNAGGETKAFLSKTFTYFTLVVFWTILVLSLFAPEILRLIVPNPLYWEAEKVVFLLSVGFGFYGMFFILSIGFYIERRTGYISAIVSATALLNIGLNLLLIPRWNIIGAGLATALSYGLMVPVTTFFVNKIYFVKYCWERALTVVVLTVTFYGLSFLWKGAAVWTNVALDLIIIVCFPFVLYLLKVFDAQDLRRAHGWVTRAFPRWNQDRH